MANHTTCTCPKCLIMALLDSRTNPVDSNMTVLVACLGVQLARALRSSQAEYDRLWENLPEGIAMATMYGIKEVDLLESQNSVPEPTTQQVGHG